MDAPQRIRARRLQIRLAACICAQMLGCGDPS
jgi:hypothetical protein